MTACIPVLEPLAQGRGFAALEELTFARSYGEGGRWCAFLSSYVAEIATKPR
jgi:hypothetical protein